VIYTELTSKALRLAYSAHHGQLDKAGMPYIAHPIHLAEQMDDELSCCAALLHDVVEDTAVTLEQLSADFPPEVILVVNLLTHREGIPYEEYLRPIARNPVALRIKLADIRHNSDRSRWCSSGVSEDEIHRLDRKYTRALEILREVR